MRARLSNAREWASEFEARSATDLRDGCGSAWREYVAHLQGTLVDVLPEHQTIKRANAQRVADSCAGDPLELHVRHTNGDWLPVNYGTRGKSGTVALIYRPGAARDGSHWLDADWPGLFHRTRRTLDAADEVDGFIARLSCCLHPPIRQVR